MLATLPFAAGIPGTERLATVVFACVPTTVFVFAVGFALTRRRMGDAGDQPDGADVAEDGVAEPEPTGSAG